MLRWWYALVMMAVLAALTPMQLSAMAQSARTHTETNSDRSIENSLTQSESETCPNFEPPSIASVAAIPLFSLSVEGKTLTLVVTGSTVFSQSQLAQNAAINAIREQNSGKNLNLAEFNAIYLEIAQSITQQYLDTGYLTSQAIATEPITIASDNTVTIQVLEGRLSAIQLQGRGRLNLEYLCDRFALGIDTPLNLTQVEKHLRLLSLNPLLEEVSASLKESGQLGLSVLVVTVREAAPFQASLGIDNYSPPSLGSERLNVDLSYGNLTGWGDELSVTYYRTTTGGGNIVDAFYRLPLNPQGGTLQLRAIPTWTKVTESDLAVFDITGNKQVYEISFRQPLWRNLNEEFALFGGFRYQNGQTFINGLLAAFDNASSRSSTLQFGQDYLSRDGDGFWFLRSQFNLGIDLFDATVEPPPIPDGLFFSWLLQAQRVQQLGKDNLLILQADLQLTPDPLLPDQLFIIGGGQSVRGYRQNIRFGDNGLRLSVEDRITLIRDRSDKSVLQIAPFIDVGAVWNAANNPNPLLDKNLLVGTGLGLIWNNVAAVEGLSLRLDYGIPLVPLANIGDNLQEQGFYFQLTYQP